MAAVAKPEADQVAFLSSKVEELQGKLEALSAAQGAKTVGVTAKARLSAAWNEFTDTWNAVEEASSPAIVEFAKDCLDQLDTIVNDPSGKFKDLPTTKQYIFYLKHNSSLALSLWPANVAHFAIMAPKEEIDKMLKDDGAMKLKVLAKISSHPKISSIVEAFRNKYPNSSNLFKSFAKKSPEMEGTFKWKLMDYAKMGSQWKKIIEKKSESPAEASTPRYRFAFDKGLKNLLTATTLPEGTRKKKKIKPRKQSESNDSLNIDQTQNGVSPKKMKNKRPSMLNDSDEHMSDNKESVFGTTPNKKKIELRKQSESPSKRNDMNHDRSQNGVSPKKKNKNKRPSMLNDSDEHIMSDNEESVFGTTPNKKKIELRKQSESPPKRNDMNLDRSQNGVSPKKKNKNKRPSMLNDSDEHIMSDNEESVFSTTPNKKKIKLRKQSESPPKQNGSVNFDSRSPKKNKKRNSKGPPTPQIK